MKKLGVAILVFLLAAVAWSACQRSYPCPYRDGATASWTGETQIINGHVFGVYHCPLGHSSLFPCD